MIGSDRNDKNSMILLSSIRNANRRIVDDQEDNVKLQGYILTSVGYMSITLTMDACDIGTLDRPITNKQKPLGDISSHRRKISVADAMLQLIKWRVLKIFTCSAFP